MVAATRPSPAISDTANHEFINSPFSRSITPINRKKAIGASVVAVIPAYNEARYIGSVVLKTLQYVDSVIVVDDGSSDETAELARLAGAIVVEHEVNQGKGEALNTGFAKARSVLVPTAIVTIDGDWQHLPEQLPNVVAPILNDEADIVIGSRYKDNSSDVPMQRQLGHLVFTTAVNVLSGTAVTDSQSGFRAFSLNAAKAIKFNSKGFGVESEMQFVANDHDLRVLEVPITIRYLDKPKRNLLKHGFKVLTGILRLIGQHRPLLFFSLPGLTILTLGAALGFWGVNIHDATQQMPMMVFLFAAIFTIMGSIALFTGLILHSLRGFIMEFVAPNSGHQ